MRLIRLVSGKVLFSLISGDIRSKLITLTGIVIFFIITGMVIASLKFGLNIGESLWWSWTHVLDPGSLGDDKDDLSRMIIGSIFSVGGLVLIGGAFITLSEEAARSAVDQLMKGRIPSGISGHTIIAGCGSKLSAFISSLKNLDGDDNSKFLVILPDQESLLQARADVTPDPNNIFVWEHVWEDTNNRLCMSEAIRLIILDNFGSDTGGMLRTILNILNDRKTKTITTPLKIHAEINNISLANTVRSVISDISDANSHVNFAIINIAEASARIALRQHPLDCCSVKHLQGTVVLVIEGWSVFSQALFWQVVKTGYYLVGPTKIIINDTNATFIETEIRAIAPGLWESWCREQFIQIDVVDSVNDYSGLLSENDIVTLVLSNSDCDTAFCRAIHYRDNPLNGLRQIFVELHDTSGYRIALEKLNTTSKVRLFSVGAAAQSFEFSEMLDSAAKAIHNRYLAQREAHGKRIKTIDGKFENKADFEWNELDENIKSWNRAAADHLDIKLRSLSDLFEFSERPTFSINRESSCDQRLVEIISGLVNSNSYRSELEKISYIEHSRWCAEKLAEGWAYAENKDNARKLSPYIRPYDELSEEIKGYDREVVLELLKYYLLKNYVLS